eukprot:jgi/Mesen1/5349/ME000267S04500
MTVTDGTRWLRAVLMLGLPQPPPSLTESVAVVQGFSARLRSLLKQNLIIEFEAGGQFVLDVAHICHLATGEQTSASPIPPSQPQQPPHIHSPHLQHLRGEGQGERGGGRCSSRGGAAVAYASMVMDHVTFNLFPTPQVSSPAQQHSNSTPAALSRWRALSLTLHHRVQSLAFHLWTR